MEPQGLDRTAIVGIILMSVILGIWLIQSAPSADQIARQQAVADSLAQVEAQAQAAAAAPDVDSLDAARAAPTDAAFARALGQPERFVTVLTDQYQARFSTQGGTPVSFQLRGYDRAGTEEPVELVSDPAGALAIGVLPSRGDYLDTRTLSFTPVVNGQPFAGDTLNIGGGRGRVAVRGAPSAAARSGSRTASTTTPTTSTSASRRPAPTCWPRAGATS